MSEISSTFDLGGSSEVGSVSEVPEANDVDYGDGDGVNDFDETSEEVEQGQENFEYQDSVDFSDCPETGEELNTDEYAEQLCNEFDEELENEGMSENDALEQTDGNDNKDVPDNANEKMSSDEYADWLSDDFWGSLEEEVSEDDLWEENVIEEADDIGEERSDGTEAKEEEPEYREEQSEEGKEHSESGKEGSEAEEKEPEDKEDQPEERKEHSESEKEGSEAEEREPEDKEDQPEEGKEHSEYEKENSEAEEKEPEDKEDQPEEGKEHSEYEKEGSEAEEKEPEEGKEHFEFEKEGSEVDGENTETVESEENCLYDIEKVKDLELADNTKSHEIEVEEIPPTGSNTSENTILEETVLEKATLSETGTSEETVIDGGDSHKSSIDLSGETEKGVFFENTSYQQGQNQYGYLGTCGPTSIANSLNRVTGTKEFTENRVLGCAIENKLCNTSGDAYEAGGTRISDIVYIIDKVKPPESNIHTEVYSQNKILSTENLANRLKDPETVAIVGVDSAVLWDEQGNVTNSGLFQTSNCSDHWITVDSPVYDDAGKLSGFNIIDSGGGVDFVDSDKFESIYIGDQNHIIEDPTVILVTSRGNSANSFTTESTEKTFAYKGNAEITDDAGPPSELGAGQIRNMETTITGRELSEEEKEVNESFRGDQFKSKDTFDHSISPEKHKELVEANSSSTCGLDSNLDGKESDNEKYCMRLTDKQKESIKDLQEIRHNVSEVNEDTVMQKVISPQQFECYVDEYSPRTQVFGCVSKASDTAPFTSNIKDAYENLRLDYHGTVFEEPARNQGDMYVMRFTTDECPSNEDYSKTDGSGNFNPPCTGTGYLGSMNHLIPEYLYHGQNITDGAIYKVDSSGNEIMVAMWNHGRFEKIE